MYDDNNPILSEFRMEADSDEWGTTMSYWFAIADYLSDMNDIVPDEWEFRQSPFGSDTESYEYQMIDEIVSSGTFEYPSEILRHTGRILSHYAALLIEAGKDY